MKREDRIAKKKARSGCSRIFRLGLTLLISLAIFAVAGGFFIHRALTTPWKGWEGDRTIVEIERGSSTRAALARLETEGLLRDHFVPLVYMTVLRPNASIKAGRYAFTEPATPLAVLDKIVRGDTLLDSITIREGLDRYAIAEIMEKAGFGTRDEWIAATDDPTPIRDLSPEADSLEGYLFPDTYNLDPGTPVTTIIGLMIENFRSQFGQELAFISTDLSVHETVTLASIVELEARLPEERSLIAGVFHNRINRGMRLQADPTVIYSLKLDQRWDGNIRKPDLSMDSPYNTYRIPGLPPGPIGNPGLASLTAAASPEATEYYYFVSRNDGSHVFSKTLDEHNRNVQVFQRDYWRDRRLAESENETTTSR